MADEIFEYAMKWGRLLGAEIFDKGFKRTNKRVFLLVVLTALTSIINIYDIYLFRGDPDRCIFCLLTISGQVQGFAKFYSFIWLYKRIISLRRQSEKFHEHFSSEKTLKIFEEKFMIVAHLTAALTFLMVCTFILIASYPIIYFLIYNERILHFGLELPLIDWKYSWIGYGINFIHQGGLLFVFICISLQTLYIIFCFVTSAICQFDALDVLLDELNELAIGNEDGSKNEEIHSRLIFLVQIQTRVDHFLQEMKQAFMIYYLIDILALIFQKTVELYAIISFNFIPGYMCVACTGCLIFLPCAISSVLISKGDKFYTNLYNISWRLMSIEDQKTLRFIILNSKKSKGLAAGIRTLELSAFLEVNNLIS
ncbi:odorant receptor 30a-like [Chironomus tepperi]|uniref:odorant receptor 30a-like n=1 Tax=Chironomus tepperi TaxID=113505 RepID=UPI00391EE6CE